MKTKTSEQYIDIVKKKKKKNFLPFQSTSTALPEESLWVFLSLLNVDWELKFARKVDLISRFYEAQR